MFLNCDCVAEGRKPGAAHWADLAVQPDQDVRALDVAVDDRRATGMQVVQTVQNLPHVRSHIIICR